MLRAKAKNNYANGVLIFENCTFNNPTGAYSIHFDGGSGDIIFKNCELYGWNSFAAALNSVTFEGCTLYGNGTYALIRSYADLTLTDCTIDTNNANHDDSWPEGIQVIGDETTFTENNVVYVVNGASELSTEISVGENLVLKNDLEDVAVDNVAPYGNWYGVKMTGGVLDGNGKTLDFDKGPLNNKGKADNYGIMISAGTVKNLKLSGVFRSIMIMNPTDDITIDNVVFDPEDEWGTCYPINTGEGDGTHSLYVKNSVIAGWNSYGSAIKDLYISNCKFVQGSYYTNVIGRLSKPYVTTVYENCDFCSMYYIDLSCLGEDNDGNLVAPETKITLKNCTINGVKLTAENWTSLVAPEATCGEGQISIELRDGSYMTAENVADYVVFE